MYNVNMSSSSTGSPSDQSHRFAQTDNIRTQVTIHILISMDLSDGSKYSKFQRIKQEEASIDFNDQQFDETKSSSHYSQIQVEKGFLSNRFLKSMSSHCATVLITLLIVIGKIIRFKISQNTNVQLFTVFILSVELSTRSKLEDKLSKMNELLFLQDELEMKKMPTKELIRKEK